MALNSAASQGSCGQALRIIPDLSLELLSCSSGAGARVRHFTVQIKALLVFNPFEAYLTPFRASVRDLLACIMRENVTKERNKKDIKLIGLSLIKLGFSKSAKDAHMMGTH